MPVDVLKVNWSSPTYVYYSDREKYQALNTIGDNAVEITTESRKFLLKLFTKIYTEQYFRLSDDIKEAVTTEVLMQVEVFNNSYWNRDLWATWAQSLTWRSVDSGKRLMRLWQKAKNQKIRDWYSIT